MTDDFTPVESEDSSEVTHDYTPTTQTVRAVWLDAYPDEFRGQGGAAFDRWLAEQAHTPTDDEEGQD